MDGQSSSATAPYIEIRSLPEKKKKKKKKKEHWGETCHLKKKTNKQNKNERNPE
eukprot:NODE_14989_length_1074_cov_4.058078.p6 GENE.NODE_14989_length_1074_cov_4.058078~~NODE_14989_length_1074_cov_4.058078.p6  ORF type:complete len:54 (+),score=16.99 NODE_14989_length_1074_cov_4.058078:821-982(+)